MPIVRINWATSLFSMYKGMEDRTGIMNGALRGAQGKVGNIMMIGQAQNKRAPLQALVMALALFGITVPLQSSLAAPEEAFNAQGYRAKHYRSPTKSPPHGVRQITPQDAAKLTPDKDAIFLDALPAEGGRLDPKTGKWLLIKAHSSIPGAHWLPNTGYGDLSPLMDNWLKDSVRTLTKGDKGRMLVVFCKSDCWMSWNVSKRLVADGYRNVRWMAEGTDGWRDLDRPLTPITPMKGPISESSYSR